MKNNCNNCGKSLSSLFYNVGSLTLAKKESGMWHAHTDNRIGFCLDCFKKMVGKPLLEQMPLSKGHSTYEKIAFRERCFCCKEPLKNFENFFSLYVFYNERLSLQCDFCNTCGRAYMGEETLLKYFLHEIDIVREPGSQK